MTYSKQDKDTLDLLPWTGWSWAGPKSSVPQGPLWDTGSGSEALSYPWDLIPTCVIFSREMCINVHSPQLEYLQQTIGKCSSVNWWVYWGYMQESRWADKYPSRQRGTRFLPFHHRTSSPNWLQTGLAFPSVLYAAQCKAFCFPRISEGLMMLERAICMSPAGTTWRLEFHQLQHRHSS